MSDPVLDIESSEQNSQPKELFEIGYGSTVHRLTSATRDVVYAGVIYTAVPIARGAVGITGVSATSGDLEVTLPIDHAIVRRWLKMGIPPKQMTATVRRYWPTEDVSETIWAGYVAGLKCNDENTEATLRVISSAAQGLLRVIPNVTAGRTCPHTLYGAMCRADRNDSRFTLTTTALYVNGRVVRYDQGNTSAEGWASYGELLHVASGERMTVRSHKYVGLPSSVVEIEMQMPLPDLKLGDSITLYAGCDRTIAQCVARFDNRQNFGGFNRMPLRNIFRPSNTGFTETGEF